MGRRPILGRAPSPDRLTTSPLELHQAGASIAAPIRMPFKVEDHDVMCLCAIVGLPKRVIVEELPPRDGRARLQLQAFTSGSICALLEWLHPALTRSGAHVLRWEDEFAFARVEVDEGGPARALWRALRAVAATPLSEVAVVLPPPEVQVELADRIEGLMMALGEERVRVTSGPVDAAP